MLRVQQFQFRMNKTTIFTNKIAVKVDFTAAVFGGLNHYYIPMTRHVGRIRVICNNKERKKLMKSINFSRDGRQIVAASAKNVVIWDVETLTVRKVIDEVVTSPAAFSDCGKILATPSAETITLQNTETWGEIDFLRLASPVTCMDFYRYRSTAQSGKPVLLMGCEDGTVAFWDVENRSQLCTKLHKKRVNFAGFISDFDDFSKDAEMVSVGEDGRLVTFRIKDDYTKPYFRITRKSKVPADTRFIDTVKGSFIFADVYGNTQLRSLYRRRALGDWSFFRGTHPVTFTGAALEFSRPAEDIIRLTALCTFSTSYSDNLLIGYADGTIRFVPIRLKRHPIFGHVKAELGDATEIFGAHTDRVTVLSYSPKRGILASGSAENEIKLWDIVKLRDWKLGDPKLKPTAELRL